MYKFSAPMPYNKKDIQKLLDINNQVEKSKITSLYASLPSTCNLYTGFEQSRNILTEKNNFDYWQDLFIYSLEKGVDLIYLLNNPMPFNFRNKDLSENLNKLDKLLKKLSDIGIRKLRAASPQLLSYLGKYYSNFDIYASTAMEYKILQEYQNLFMLHPEIKQIVPSHDVNKNFMLLSNIKKEYPKIDIEIMVNEGCMTGCPNRIFHQNTNNEKIISINNDLYSSNMYYIAFCNGIATKYPFYSLTLNYNIYPWEIKEYEKIGITKFKLVGRDNYTFKMENYLNAFLLYLKGIDNIKIVEDVPVTTFIHHLLNNPKLKLLLVKECRNFLPKINYFKKYGHLCSSRCGAECRYCYNCAEKIQKYFIKKQKIIENKNISQCYISNNV